MKLQGLSTLAIADVRDFHRARYLVAGTILAIVGDVEAKP